MQHARKITRLVMGLACAAASIGMGVAHASPCTGEASARGEWPSYGGDKANTRNQALETTIGATNAGNLSPKWTFSVATASGVGAFQATPAVSGGCVFVGTDGGTVFALDAANGSLIWKRQFPVGGQVAGIFGLAVSNGLVYGNSVDDTGPFAFALHQSDGTDAWRSESLKSLGTTINASAVVYDGLDFVALWGDDPNPEHHDGYAILDATDGTIITKRYVIPEKDWVDGYAGGGIWATAAIDTATGYAYLGNANPYSKTKEHPYTNALLKIDLNRESDTFGSIVASYKGRPDNYVGDALYSQPVCEALGPQQSSYSTAGCFQIDIDFGASPSLWHDANGRLLVGDQQKAGVFHAADATTMSGVWQQVDSAPLLLGNAGTSTVSGNLVVASANPGIVYGFDKTTGAIAWLYPTLDGVRYEALSSANGVVYAVDGLGTLSVIDAATGLPLARRSIGSDAGGTPAAGLLTSAGASIAEGMVFAPSSGTLVAYGL